MDADRSGRYEQERRACAETEGRTGGGEREVRGSWEREREVRGS